MFSISAFKPSYSATSFVGVVMFVACPTQKYRNSCYTADYTTCKATRWRPAPETQGSVACKLQDMQPRSHALGNSGRRQVCLEGEVLQCSEWIRGTTRRRGQGSSHSKKGSLSLSLLLLLRHTHLRHVVVPVRSRTKPSLRFIRLCDVVESTWSESESKS